MGTDVEQLLKEAEATYNQVRFDNLLVGRLIMALHDSTHREKSLAVYKEAWERVHGEGTKPILTNWTPSMKPGEEVLITYEYKEKP